MSHTSGPWTVKPSASHNGFTVWTGTKDDTYISVFCSYGDGRQTEQERKSIALFDARLIAAAPDMLAAGQAMVDDYQTSESHHPNHVLVPKSAFEAMQAAITKATEPTP